MKRVLCYGDSNTFGTAPMRHIDDMHRLGPEERWPGVLALSLGPGWTVIEEGLPGRTTVHDDPIEGVHKNGKAYLLPCLESHWPLDLVALMLGTNDLKARFSLTPADIAAGVGALLLAIKAAVPPWTRAPKLLLIAPPPAESAGWLGEWFTGAGEKSRRLAGLYRDQAERNDAAFLDAGAVAQVSPLDGVHFDPADHKALGLAVAAEVKRLAG